ncbi:MAG TPA: hypothetical protein VFA89_15940 [Terriglobales bacterium]|nr:hypothetical protein [Terriglobales bacterium]
MASLTRKKSKVVPDHLEKWFCDLMEADAFLYDELADSLEATLPQLTGAERAEVVVQIRERRKLARESREWLRIARGRNT